jgi:hypothetical protein
MDVVEVIPTGIGSSDITALVAARIVHETLTGIAQRKRLELTPPGNHDEAGSNRGATLLVKP